MNAKQWVDALQLRRHPEGGYFRETYRSGEIIRQEHLPERFKSDHDFSTAIYFLIGGDEFSALHRINQDEVWHFYDGSSLTIHSIDPAGIHAMITLGRNVQAGEVLQAVVQAGWLFGALVSDPGSFALVGCTVAPGFQFSDFTMPAREELLRLYPEHRQVIERLTR